MKRGLVFLLLVSVPAQAEEITHLVRAGTNQAQVGVGLAPTPVATLGYQRGVSLVGRDVAVGVTWTVPLFLEVVRHLDLGLSARAPLVEGHGLALLARVGVAVNSTANHVFSAVQLRTEASLIAGWFPRYGFVALRLGVRQGLMTGLTPGEAYLRSVPEARGGLFGSTTGGASAGLEGGLVIMDRVELVSAFGLDFAWRGSTLVPIHLSTGVNVRF